MIDINNRRLPTKEEVRKECKEAKGECRNCIFQNDKYGAGNPLCFAVYDRTIKTLK